MGIAEKVPDLVVDEAEWGWLRAHLERGGIVVVSMDEELVATGHKIATDDTAAVNALIQAGKLKKPSREEIEVWDRNREKRFRMLIVSPYVLIQEDVPPKEVLQ